MSEELPPLAPLTPPEQVEALVNQLCEQDEYFAREAARLVAHRWMTLPERVVDIALGEVRDQPLSSALVEMRVGDAVEVLIKNREMFLKELLIPASAWGLIIRLGIYSLIVAAIAGFFISILPPQQSQKQIELPKPKENHVIKSFPFRR